MAQLDWYIRANFKPRHLQLLVAMDEFRNIRKVADHVNVTQPAVSKALAEMEKGLGARLFERTPRGIHPTVYGECMIRHARTLLMGLNHARDELRGLMSGSHGKTSVGALPAATPALLPASLALLKQRSPTTTVLVREATSDALLADLRLGNLDLVVGTLPSRSASNELEERIVSDEPQFLIAGTDHPLARRRRLAWRDLKGFPWVLPPVGSLKREPLEATFERYGIPLPSDVIETASVHMIHSYVQMTHAVAVLAGSVARHYQSLGLIAILPLELPKLVRPFGMLWNRERPLSPATRLMMDCVQEASSKPLAVVLEELSAAMQANASEEAEPSGLRASRDAILAARPGEAG